MVTDGVHVMYLVFWRTGHTPFEQATTRRWYCKEAIVTDRFDSVLYGVGGFGSANQKLLMIIIFEKKNICFSKASRTLNYFQQTFKIQ